jgi:hypothetical protein
MDEVCHIQADLKNNPKAYLVFLQTLESLGQVIGPNDFVVLVSGKSASRLQRRNTQIKFTLCQ